MTSTPTFSVESTLTAERLELLLPDLVRRSLAPFIASQRWYGDKSRNLQGVEPIACSILSHEGSLLVLLGLEISFAEGDPVEYFVPLSLSRSESTGSVAIAEITSPGARWSVTDAVQTSGFHRWLLEELARETTDSSGRFRWTATSAAAGALSSAMLAESRVSSAQQSNSSIVYGTSVILKVFRRISPGINPEVELGRFLTTRTSFRNMPLLLGEWSYLAAAGGPRSLAVAQSFVPNIGDGWSHILQSLRSPSTAGPHDARRLGELTADLHLALESARSEPDLAPEPILPDDAADWTNSVVRAVRSTATALESVAYRETGDTRELIDAFLSLAPRLSAQASGFERLIGRSRTRVHGDYHLGQTLRTVDGDFVILDFEGEPQRPIEERRAKTSPLKDVAGMLRSFGYARGAAEREMSDRTGSPDRAPLIAWERAARLAFIDSYVEESRRGGAGYLPTSDDDIRQALAAWELDKALYEVNYELNNRPDWLALPLAATLTLT
jgi:maltose alpha-D-glucosyltransferase/alpha-amylase